MVLYAEVCKIYGKNESSLCDTGRKDKEIHISVPVSPQTAKLGPQRVVSA